MWPGSIVELGRGISIRVQPHERAALLFVAECLRDLTDAEAKALWKAQRAVDDGTPLPDDATIQTMRKGMTRLVALHGPEFVRAWHVALVDGLGTYDVMARTSAESLARYPK